MISFVVTKLILFTFYLVSILFDLGSVSVFFLNFETEMFPKKISIILNIFKACVTKISVLIINRSIWGDYTLKFQFSK